MFEPIKHAYQRAKIATRFVFGQSETYSSYGYMNPDEPTSREQRNNYRGLFFKCVNIRAKQVSQAMHKAKVVRIESEGEFEDVEYDHPWNQKLKRPLSNTQTTDFWEWVSLSRDLLGHAHSLVDEWERFMGAQMPKSFLPVYSEFGDLNPVPNARGGVDAWEFWRNDGQKFRYDTKEVLAFRRTSPYNPYKTMSLVQAAMHELDVDLYMKTYRKDSVRDGGITSDVLSTDQTMNDTQRGQISQDFKKYKGQRGQNNVLVLSHGLDLVKTNMDARDLQYIEGNIQNANDLRFITGVPEALYSKDANRAVLEGAERVMVQYTINPIVSAMCRQLTTEFEKIFGADPGALMVMPPNINPIDEDLEIKRRESYLRTGQRTIDEYRALDGVDEYPDGIGNVPLVNFSQTPLREVVTLNDEFDAKDQPERAARAIKKKDSPDRAYLWRQIDAERQREEKKTVGSVHNVFDLMKKAALENIESRRNIRIESPIISVEQILSLIEARDIVNRGFRSDIIRLIRVGFERGLFNMDVTGLDFQINSQQVRQLLILVARKNQFVADTTINQLTDALQAGLNENESIDELTERVSLFFDDAKQARSQTIAQTMTTSAFEGGQLISFRNAGATAKSWLSQRDGRQRETHLIADKTQNEIPLNQAFEVGGEKLQHPGDPNASSKEVVGCRCSMLPVM